MEIFLFLDPACAPSVEAWGRGVEKLQPGCASRRTRDGVGNKTARERVTKEIAMKRPAVLLRTSPLMLALLSLAIPRTRSTRLVEVPISKPSQRPPLRVVALRNDIPLG